MFLLLPFLFALLAGILFAAMRLPGGRLLRTLAVAAAAVEALLLTLPMFFCSGAVVLWRFSDTLSVALGADGIGALLGLLAGWGWFFSVLFATEYMTGEEKESRFYGCLFLSEACLVCVFFAANLLTLYLFFELLTLLSLPLVLHTGTKDAVAGAFSYLFYSIAGAILALFGIFVVYHAAGTLDFAAGGYLSANAPLILSGVFACVLGFGAKAGLYPLHAWLPAAHPQAPAPASALLSGLITKSGVMAILRLLYYIVVPDSVRGTWVQNVLLGLALLTVLVGSAMALPEKNFKRRLAFSSVSQVSYVLVGLFLFDPTALTGSVLQILFHMIAKVGLFLCAGALIHLTNKTGVEEFVGYGRVYPAVFVCYTMFSLSLIGIPPFGGFFSKWALAVGALHTSGVFAWLAPVVLLLSALLTAGYLLPMTVHAFFPGKDAPPLSRQRCPAALWLPLVILAAAALIPGIFYAPLQAAITALLP